jgi:hypothetical protein
MAAVVDDGDGYRPALLLCFGACSGEDLGDFFLAEYGFVLHDTPRVLGLSPPCHLRNGAAGRGFRLQAIASSTISIQWRTGVRPAPSRWVWQPMLAVTMASGLPLSSALSLLSRSCRDSSGWVSE